MMTYSTSKTKVINMYHGVDFDIDIDGTRLQVIDKFEKYARDHFSKNEILELQGKRLGCVCFPKPCHGDVYIKLIQEYSSII